MDDTQLQTILQNMGSLLGKISEATSILLEQNVRYLVPGAVAEQRGRAEEIRQGALSLRSMLRSIGQNL